MPESEQLIAHFQRLVLDSLAGTVVAVSRGVEACG